MFHADLARAYAAHRKVDQAVVEALRARAPVGRSSRALEVGCGTGNHVVALHEATGAWCCGIDPSEAMLAIARRHSAAFPFVRGVAESLPFRDDGLDLVFFVDVMHHLRDPALALVEAFRVARPGASVCVATEDEAGIRARLHSRYFLEVVPVELARYPPIDGLCAVMEACGGARVERQRTLSLYPVTDIAPYSERAFSSLHRIPDEAYRVRSEERRVGKECRTVCRSRWSPYH